MRSATWCIVFCVLIFLVISDGKKDKDKDKEDLPQKYCPRIEDIEGNCKDNGPKVCAKFMTEVYKLNYFNCTCDNMYMLHKIKRYCRCQSLCSDHPPPAPVQPH
ncbi:hypothetical protein Bca4012_022553 [Brassica carinata]